jgi:hypothetical protein
MAPASSTASPAATGSSRLTGVLATATDLETWAPADEREAQEAIGSVAAYCRDYCPVRLACVEEACRLFRLERRADAVIRHTPAERVGVLGQPVTAL